MAAVRREKAEAAIAWGGKGAAREKRGLKCKKENAREAEI